jgi:hypothetical protein
MISNFHRVFNIVCILLGISRRQIVICRRFGTLCQFHLQRLGVEYWVTQSRRQITIWRRGNTQKNTYNIQNTAKVWNEECFNCPAWIPICFNYFYSSENYLCVWTICLEIFQSPWRDIVFAVTRTEMSACETRSSHVIVNYILLKTAKPVGRILLCINPKEILLWIKIVGIWNEIYGEYTSTLKQKSR